MQTKYDQPLSRVIELLAQAGFCGVSPLWSAELDTALLKSCVDARGMVIQSFHAPHGGLAYLWNSQAPLSAPTAKNITDCIDACARYQIPLMVMHGWQGLKYTVPPVLDFSVFDRIVDYAAEKNITIAFENLEGEEYLSALMSRYDDRPHIGFCWDSGHDHCYPHKTDFLEAYGQKLIMTHLNDNYGQRDPSAPPTGDDDLHFLPFDGNIPWAEAIGKMKDLPRQKMLNFELKKRSISKAPKDLIYDPLTLEEFFLLAGQRARQIADLYDAL